MRAVLATALVLASAGTAAASPATGPTWTVRAFSDQRWLSRSSAVTLSQSTLDGGGLAIERRVLGVHLPGPFPLLEVSADLDAESGSTDGTTFQGQLDNHISSWELTAGARARLPLLSWLALDARGAVGGARTHVRISDASAMSSSIADAGDASVFAAALGLSALPRLTPRSALRLGVEVELGYQQTTATPIRATPENRPPADLTIPAQYASLGSLDLDGWCLRIGATIGF